MAFLVALFCTAPFILSPDFLVLALSFLFLGPALAIFGLFLLASVWIQKGRKRLANLLAVGVLLATSIVSLDYGSTNGRDLADLLRWQLYSDDYKDEMGKRPSSAGDLPHLLWNGWGWAGMDTSAYLVYDASDTMLLPPYRSREGGVAGVPCQVSHVNRIAPGWYVVTMYTDTDWNQCGRD